MMTPSEVLLDEPTLIRDPVNHYASLIAKVKEDGPRNGTSMFLLNKFHPNCLWNQQLQKDARGRNKMKLKWNKFSNVLVSKVSWKSTKVPLLHWLQSIDWPICRRTPGRAGLFACSLGSRGGWSGHAPFGKVSLLLAVIFVWRMNVNLWNGWLMFAKAEASMWPLRRLRFQGISLAQRYVAELIDQAGVQWCANGFSCRYKPWSVVEKFLTFGGNSLKHDSCKCLAA